jgi:hypothetical protein
MANKNEQIEEEKFEVDGEAIAKAIEDIAKGMRSLDQSRLKRETIIILIHDQSKVAKKTIRVVLNNLKNLESDWLK